MQKRNSMSEKNFNPNTQLVHRYKNQLQETLLRNQINHLLLLPKSLLIHVQLLVMEAFLSRKLKIMLWTNKQFLWECAQPQGCRQKLISRVASEVTVLSWPTSSDKKIPASGSTQKISECLPRRHCWGKVSMN